ncbi:MAG: hypothetical protein HY334_01640 [Armatimonadetes bacterium]|nr:hypothetical protein [Armatimonadota bacterium]
MKKLLVALGLAILVSAALWLPTGADHQVGISASVTVKNVCVTVSPTSIDYGTLDFEASQASNTLATPVTFLATNCGTASESFLARGANATAGSTTWTIQAAAPNCATPDINLFRHSLTRTAPTADTEKFLTTSNTSWVTGIGATSTASFNTKLYMPCHGSGGAGSTAATSVTVVATQP